MNIYNFFKILGKKLSFREQIHYLDPDLLDYKDNHINATARMFYEHDADNAYLMKHFNYTKARNAEAEIRELADYLPSERPQPSTNEELNFKLVQQIFHNILPITKSGITEFNCQKSVHAVVKLVLEEKLVSIEALHRCLNHRYPNDNDYNRTILDKETTWLFEQGYFANETKLKSLLAKEIQTWMPFARAEQELEAQQICRSIMARQLEYKLPEHSEQKVKRPKI